MTGPDRRGARRPRPVAGRRPSRLRAAGLPLVLLLAGSAGLAAQAPRTAVGADTVRVGDVVPVAVRMTLEPGHRVAWPDTLPLGDDRAENAARLRERVDTLPDGRLEVTGIYTVTPWRPGALELGALPIRVLAPDGAERTARVELPELDVVSVLPSDTTGLAPKSAKGVLGASWAWLPLLLGLLVLLALLVALAAWLRRRMRGSGSTAAPAVSPRERALARLQAALDEGLLEAGDTKGFYSRITRAVREYAAALHAEWGEDLTSTEILARFRAAVGPAEATRLSGILRPADQVKFARREPDPATARGEWEAARSWVAGFDWPPPAPAEQEDAA